MSSSHGVVPTAEAISFSNGWRTVEYQPKLDNPNIFINSGIWSGDGIAIGFQNEGGSDIICGRFTPDEAEEVALAILIRVREIRGS